MKKMFKKEKKEFNRDYIPVIIGGILLLALVGVLLLLVFTNFDFKIGSGSKENGTTEFEHQEIVVDISESTCDTKKMDTYIKDANSITINYSVEEVNEGPAYDEDGDYLNRDIIREYVFANFGNISDNLSIRITNDATDAEYIIDGKTTKTYKMQKMFSSNNVQYTVEIYTNDDCFDKEIRKFTIYPPSINKYYEYEVCDETSSLHNTKYCEKIIYGEPYTDEEIMKVYKEEDREKYFEKLDEKYNSKSNVVIIIIVIIACIILVLLILLMILKKRGRKNEKI